MGRGRRDLQQQQQDMSTLVTHASQAVVPGSSAHHQHPLALGGRGTTTVAPPTGSGAATMVIQGMPLSSQQPTSGLGISAVVGSLGGNLYVTSDHTLQNPASRHAPMVVKGMVSAMPPGDGGVATNEVVRNPATPSPQQQQDTPPHLTRVPAGEMGSRSVGVALPAPSSHTSPPPLRTLGADSLTTGAPPSEHVRMRGGVASRKRGGRRKRHSPVLHQEPLPPSKRRRGRPRGSGVRGGGRRGGISSRSRLLSSSSHNRYANILPRPDLVSKGATPSSSAVLPSVQGVLQSGGALVTSDPAGSSGGVVSVVGGEVQGSLEEGVSSKDVAVAAANCSAALSLGTRKVSTLSYLPSQR